MEEYKRVTKWMISVRSGNNRRDFEFSGREEETPQDTYRRVKSNADKIAKQFEGKNVTVDLISLSVAFKPKGVKPFRSWYWCPYCNKYRVFSFDPWLEINRCSVCGISDQDFYVRKYNGLFGSPSDFRPSVSRKVRK